MDGDRVGNRDSLTTPHAYDVTEQLTPGDHWLTLRDDAQTWDEFNPVFYRLRIAFRNSDSRDYRELRIGMRDFATAGTPFQVNGRATFLRGKHDACVFPLTGYAPMDAAEWKRVLTIARSYGRRLKPPSERHTGMRF